MEKYILFLQKEIGERFALIAELQETVGLKKDIQEKIKLKISNELEKIKMYDQLIKILQDINTGYRL
jgi:hypothetical protein